jgi:hypothetical protein
MSGQPSLPLNGAAFRLRPPPPPFEDELQEAVAKSLTFLLLPPAVWFAMPVGHLKLTPAQAARLTRIGVRRGLPDIMLIYNAKPYGIELKRGSASLSVTRTVRTKRGGLRVLEGQQDVFPRLAAAGMQIAVCRSVDQVLYAIRRWGIPLRPFT